MPNFLYASRWLVPCRKPREPSDTIPQWRSLVPPCAMQKRKMWTTFKSPAAGLSRRYTGLIFHRRSHQGLRMFAAPSSGAFGGFADVFGCNHRPWCLSSRENPVTDRYCRADAISGTCPAYPAFIPANGPTQENVASDIRPCHAAKTRANSRRNPAKSPFFATMVLGDMQTALTHKYIAARPCPDRFFPFGNIQGSRSYKDQDLRPTIPTGPDETGRTGSTSRAPG